ncbi:MAG: UTP--glucose-1-phosphate uridylyltransferase GalU [Actinobacteria bacterium]|nr:UTP--glucose-1-phosphate uridylyltransferase GalU [Actinomycetota bacterium]MDP2232593.1 UTP--glucose-1-phosphate uridylyltransferase GalU [Actinomycetota bacterium]
MKAIIPAAGLGTRFLPVTKSQPKEMLPVVDKPVIQYVVEEAAHAGADDILIITGRGKRAIEDHFDRSLELEDLLERSGNVAKLREVRNISELADVFYVRQKRPRGLGHAVMCGAPFTNDEPFFVMLGDVLVPKNDCLPKLKDVHDRLGGSVIAVTPVEQRYVSRYGVIGGHEVEPGVWQLTDLVEKPPVNEAPSNLAIFGRYLLTPKIMEILPKIEPGRGDEIQLTDALRELLKHEEIFAVTMECEGYDTGNVLSWLEANIALALETEELGPHLRESLVRLLG